MSTPVVQQREGIARLYTWRRLKPPLIAAFVVSLILLPGWQVSYAVLIVRLVMLALVMLTAFGILERWPKRLPSWLARWGQSSSVRRALPIAPAPSTR